jgi:DNA-binding NarL/FixJ family response regulator
MVVLAIRAAPGSSARGRARDLEVLRLVGEGYSNRKIARTLVICQRTVASHVEHILATLPAPTGTHAVRTERARLYVPARAEEGRRR